MCRFGIILSVLAVLILLPLRSSGQQTISISQLPLATSGNTTDLFPVAQVTPGTFTGYTVRKLTGAQLVGFLGNISVGNSVIAGGINTRVLFDNAGVIGEYTNAQLTALIQTATASLSGALPAFPGTLTTFFRGDGTYQTLNCASLLAVAASCSTDTTNAANISSGTLPAGRLPALTGDVTTTVGTVATTIAANAVTNAKLAAAGAQNTVKGAATSTTEADLAVPSCSTASSALTWTTNTGFGCNSIGASSRQIIPVGCSSPCFSQNTTSFVLLEGGFASEASASVLCPISGTFKNLFVQSSAPASGQTLTATWRVNNASTALTCTVTGVGTTCNDTVHTATCTAGQTYDLQIVTSATSGVINNFSGGIEFDNP